MNLRARTDKAADADFLRGTIPPIRGSVRTVTSRNPLLYMQKYRRFIVSKLGRRHINA